MYACIAWRELGLGGLDEADILERINTVGFLGNHHSNADDGTLLPPGMTLFDATSYASIIT